MKALQHPFYEEESRNLVDTIREIQVNLNSNIEGVEGEFWTNRADIEIQQQNYHKRIEKLKRLLKKPYFGRVDWLQDNLCDTFYVGNELFQQKNVYAWQHSLAGDLYYGLSTKKENGELLLKRTFEINCDQLLTIADDYVDPKHPKASILQSIQYVDEVLLNLLSESRKTQLRDIVATIQAQQYQLIQSPLDEILLIQGAPGSGKTVIALHRLSYLLYHHKELSAPRLLVLGPSQLFLHHTSNVLPILGERQIPQKTFIQWTTEQLGINIEFDTPENVLEMFLDKSVPLIQKVITFRNDRNKGSLRMALLLERYVDLLMSQMFADKENLICRYLPKGLNRGQSGNSIRVEKSLEQILSLLDSLKSIPLNKRKGQLIENLVREISQETQRNLPVSDAFKEAEESEDILADIRRQVTSYLDDWHELNVSIAYRQLFRKPELLHQAGEGIFTPWELELLLLDVPKKARIFHASDLPGLLYFNILLNGEIPNEDKYHHIVIDEAQDMSSLHYKVISRYCRENSMTILGDLGQGIYINQGISRWEDLESPHFRFHKEIIQRSYRSTAQISNYTRKIIKKIMADEILESVPFARDGNEPAEVEYSSWEDLVNSLPKVIDQEKINGWKTISVICKSFARCTRLAHGLEAIGFMDFQLIDTSATVYNGGVAILPSYLAKGLEFDVVIVADADNETYTSNELDAHLLYVALTRAAQSLHIFWIGEKTAWLNPDINLLIADSFLSGYIQPRSITIEDYASKHNREGDWYVEHLASEDKLLLLADGKMDEIFLDAFFFSKQSNNNDIIDEANLIDLPEVLKNILFEKVAEALSEKENGDGLALSQLTFNLLRGHLRKLGAVQTEDDNISLIDQIELLARLYYTIKKNQIDFTAGRWTTKRKVIEKLPKDYRAAGKDILQILLDYGIVEEKLGDQVLSSTNRGALIRIIPQFILGILDLVFGYEPSDWDDELIKKLPYTTLVLDLEMGDDNE